jgi:hypothetical protein
MSEWGVALGLALKCVEGSFGPRDGRPRTSTREEATIAAQMVDIQSGLQAANAVAELPIAPPAETSVATTVELPVAMPVEPPVVVAAEVPAVTPAEPPAMTPVEPPPAPIPESTTPIPEASHA